MSLHQTTLPGDPGKLTSHNATLMETLGWDYFFKQSRGRGNFASPGAVQQPACHLLRQYKHRGAPVVFAEESWTEGGRQVDLAQGPHQSAPEHTPFIRKNFDFVVGKGQWVILPYLVTRNPPGLCLNPPRFKEERYRRPWWLAYYIYSKLKCSTLPLAKLSSMQYVQSLSVLFYLIER